jgi:hypothetical protein
MIGYTTIGAKDSEASGKFYDAVFSAMGGERKFADGGWIGYGAVGPDKGFTGCHTMVTGKPNNGQEAHAGNGIMLAYKAPSPDAVKAAYAGGMAKASRASVRRMRRRDSMQPICAIRPATKSASSRSADYRDRRFLLSAEREFGQTEAAR